MNWPIIQGEARTGLSVFWPDAGLDTGPILLQKEVDIAPDDTLGALYFDKLFPMGVEAMVEAVGMVRNGTAPRVEQDESEATYEGWCRAKECVVDWERPVEEVYNLLRGTDPQPGAMTSFNGTSVQLYRTARVEKESGGLPGSIVEVDEEGVVVAAADGRLRIGRVKPKGGPKATAFEWAQEAGLEVGMTLGE